MAALLIPAAFLLFVVVLLCREGVGFREAILKSALLLLLVIAVSTEVLSLFRAVTLRSLVLVWQTVNLFALIILLCVLRSRNGHRRAVRKLRHACSKSFNTRRAVVFATLTALVVLLTFFMAALQYPYDTDSVSYHMPRVSSWINHGHVGFYPTVNQRQNFYAPLSSYAVMHIQLLSGTDRFSVFTQYGGMLLSLTLLAKIAARLGLGAAGQWFTVAVSATVPMLIAQSHSNQNELVLSALMLGFVWLLLQLARRPGVAAVLWCGLALGLALLTKGTAFIYGAAIGVSLGLYAVLRRPPPRFSRLRMAACLAAAAILGLSMTLPFKARCSRGDYNYLQNEYTAETRNERLGVDILAANAIRNAAMHFWLPAGEWNGKVVEWVRDRIGEQEANMESTFRALAFRLQARVCCFHASNPLHLVTALAALLLLPLIRAKPYLRGLIVAYALASVLAGLLFNLLLKWQYWGIRLQLPWFLITMPLAALVFFRIRLPDRLRAIVQVGAAVMLFLAALPALLSDHDVPLWQTRKAPLFLRDAASIRLNSTQTVLEGKHGHHRTAEFLRTFQPDEVGLLVPRCNASRDYHWWVAFENHARPNRPLLRHVAPDAWPAPDLPPPEFVIADRRTPDDGLIQGRPYESVYRAGRIRVYRRSEQE